MLTPPWAASRTSGRGLSACGNQGTSEERREWTPCGRHRAPYGTLSYTGYIAAWRLSLHRISPKSRTLLCLIAVAMSEQTLTTINPFVVSRTTHARISNFLRRRPWCHWRFIGNKKWILKIWHPYLVLFLRNMKSHRLRTPFHLENVTSWEQNSRMVPTGKYPVLHDSLGCLSCTTVDIRMVPSSVWVIPCQINTKM